MTTATVIGLLATQASGAAGAPSPSTSVSSVAAAVRVSAPEKCHARKGLRFYRGRYVDWRELKGGVTSRPSLGRRPRNCADARYLAKVWKRKAHAARRQYERWVAYHWHWRSWLPDKWARIGACETGYGKRPGNWRHSNSSYGGAFGFAHSSWRAFVPRADPKAGPYPANSWQATPRQQYEVALAIYRMYGLSGWGCRGA